MMLLLYEAALLRGCGAVEGNYMPLELTDEVNGCIVVGKEQRFQLIGASLGIRSLVSLRLSSLYRRTGTARFQFIQEARGNLRVKVHFGNFPSWFGISSGC